MSIFHDPNEAQDTKKYSIHIWIWLCIDIIAPRANRPSMIEKGADLGPYQTNVQVTGRQPATSFPTSTYTHVYQPTISSHECQHSLLRFRYFSTSRPWSISKESFWMDQHLEIRWTLDSENKITIYSSVMNPHRNYSFVQRISMAHTEKEDVLSERTR